MCAKKKMTSNCLGSSFGDVADVDRALLKLISDVIDTPSSSGVARKDFDTDSVTNEVAIDLFNMSEYKLDLERYQATLAFAKKKCGSALGG